MKVRFAQVSKANLSSVHVTDGQLVVVKDTGDIYYDNVVQRVKLSDVIPVTQFPTVGLEGKLYLNLNTYSLHVWNGETQTYDPIVSETTTSGDIYQYPLIFDDAHKTSALPYGRILGMPVVLKMSGANNPSITLRSANPINMASFGIPDEDGWITPSVNYDTTVTVSNITNGTVFFEIASVVNPITVNGTAVTAGVRLIPVTGSSINLRVVCALGGTKFRCWASVIPNPAKNIAIDVATNGLKKYTPYFAPYTVTIHRNVSGAYDYVEVNEDVATSVIRTGTTARTSANANIAIKYTNDGTNYTTTIIMWWPGQFGGHTMTSAPLQKIPSTITVSGSVDASVVLTTEQTQLEPILPDGSTAIALGVIYKYTSTTNQTVAATVSNVLSQIGVGSFTLHELKQPKDWVTYTDTVNDVSVFGRAEAGVLTVNTNNTNATVMFASDWRLAYIYQAASGDTSTKVVINDYDQDGRPLVGISALKIICMPAVRTPVRDGGKKDLQIIEPVALESVHAISTTKYDWMGDLTPTWIMTVAELDALPAIWSQGGTILFYAK